MNRGKKLLSLVLLLPALASAAGANLVGNVNKGGDYFDEDCGECHSLKPGKVNKGPSLFGVMNRPSASQTNYVYSDTLKAAKWIWTAERVDAYLKSPRTVVPKGRMKYDGIADAQSRADVIAFLSTIK